MTLPLCASVCLPDNVTWHYYYYNDNKTHFAIIILYYLPFDVAFIQQCDRCTATVRAWRDWGQWLIIRAERVAHRWELCCKHCTYTHSSQCCRWSEHAVIIDTPGELCLSLSVTCTARELADRRHAAGHCYTRRTIVKIGPLFRDRPVIIAWWRWRAGGSAKRDTVCQLSSIYARDKFPCHLPCIAAAQARWHAQ